MASSAFPNQGALVARAAVWLQDEGSVPPVYIHGVTLARQPHSPPPHLAAVWLQTMAPEMISSAAAVQWSPAYGDIGGRRYNPEAGRPLPSGHCGTTTEKHAELQPLHGYLSSCASPIRWQSRVPGAWHGYVMERAWPHG